MSTKLTADPAAVTASPLMAQYGTAQERESAAEKLAAQTAGAAAEGQAQAAPSTGESVRAGGTTVVSGVDLGDIEALRREEEQRERRAEEKEERQSEFERAMGSFVRSAGTQLGREVVRSVFGTRRRGGGGLLGGLFG